MIGFRILECKHRVAQSWAEKFRALPVANISDVMARITAGGPGLRPMHLSGVLSGPAFTVKTRPGDNLMVHKALDLAQPGDVIVVDAGGDLTNAIIGEIMVSTAQKRGIAGLVINGAVRDVGAIGTGHFPVYAAGITHRGPYKNGPGEINVSISLDGMIVEPGDLIVGDEDGLLCVPFDHIDAVYEAAKTKHELEIKIMADIANGSLDTSWIDASLNHLNCEIVK